MMTYKIDRAHVKNYNIKVNARIIVLFERSALLRGYQFGIEMT